MQIKDSIAGLSGTRRKNISSAKNKIDGRKYLNFYDFRRSGTFSLGFYAELSNPFPDCDKENVRDGSASERCEFIQLSDNGRLSTSEKIAIRL